MTIVGSFINALFNFLLGWIRGTAQWLWNMVTSDSHGGLLGWAMRNWLPLVIPPVHFRRRDGLSGLPDPLAAVPCLGKLLDTLSA